MVVEGSTPGIINSQSEAHNLASLRPRLPRPMAEETELLPPTLQNVLDQQSLKWIFCGMYW